MVSAQLRLREEFEKRKRRNPLYSLRSFARWLEISPAQLSQLLSGKRRLSRKHGALISEKLDLSPREKREFLACTAMEKEPPASREILKEEEFRSISEWYHFGILSLLETRNARSDPRWISRRLGIPVSTATEAVERLIKLGIVERHPRLRQCKPPLEVVTDAPSSAIRRYHRQTLELAQAKLESVPKDLREFHSITFPADPARIERVRELIDRFLSDISAEMETSDSTEVYCASLQIFPATKPSFTGPRAPEEK